MDDLSWVSAFANNPVTMTILTVGAIAVIFMWKVAPLLKDMHLTNHAVNDKIDKIAASDKEQHTKLCELTDAVTYNARDILRLGVYNTSAGVEEQLIAAKRYLLVGGNGKTKVYVNALIEKNRSEWNMLVAMSSDEERNKLKDILGGDNNSMGDSV
jgi:hypothetical protein